MRATLSTTYRSLLANLNSSSNRLNDLRIEAATGKKMTKPSDDPSGIRPVLNARTEIRNADRYLRTMGSASDRLKNLDSNLERADNLMLRLKEVVVAAGNVTLGAQDLATLGDQVAQIKDEMLAVANTKVDGKYLFAGYEEATQPFDGTPGNYFGDNNVFELEVGPSEKVRVNLTGQELFGDPGSGQDIWGLLDTLTTALNSNDAAGALAELDDVELAADQIRGKRSQMGNIGQRIDDAMLSMEDTRIDMTEILSRYEDADFLETVTNMTQQETAFKAALDVTSRVSQLSILNYMR